jgi:hypothetical protein
MESFIMRMVIPHYPAQNHLGIVRDILAILTPNLFFSKRLFETTNDVKMPIKAGFINELCSKPASPPQ